MKRLKQRWKATAAFMTMMLLITLSMTLLPEVTASPNPVKINSITPSEGCVGETVRVVGEIDTVNGTYQILWDGRNVTEGTCELGAQVVNDTFVVPLSVEGYHDIALYDVNSTNVSLPVSFGVMTSYFVSVEPSWVQEGLNANITVGVNEAQANVTYTFTVNVTEPQPTATNYTTSLTISTNATGSGSNSTLYYQNFSAGANTNHVGTYSITVLVVNQTFATGSFSVSLTDRPEYRREETVSIRGSGYHTNENVTINITIAEVSVTGYPKNVTADEGGVVIDSWAIPNDAKPGTHTVTLTNATSDGTVKTPADAQNFSVLGAICLIQTWNLADPPEPVAKVIVEASNATTNTLLETETSNKTGWVEFWLELGNYNFEAFFMIGEDFTLLGSLQNQSIAETTTYKLNLTCQLSHIKITIHDEAKNPLPFINVTLTYTYTARDNRTIPQVERFETNSTGTVASFNTIANISYEIEARRYGHLFNRTLVENLTVPLWVNITCPTYTMFVHVVDSKDLPIQNVDVDVIEWGGGILVDRKTTNTLGSVAFSYTFGRYKVRVYNGSATLENTVVLNETVIDLIEDQFFLPIYCKIYNIDLSLSVIDYYGQPIANVEIKIERDGVEVESLTTGKDGKVSRQGIIGGNYRFSIYVLGKLAETRTFYLDRDKELAFKIDRYIVIGGYPLEIVQFIALVSLSILVAIFVLALAYRRISVKQVKKEEESTPQKE